MQDERDRRDEEMLTEAGDRPTADVAAPADADGHAEDATSENSIHDDAVTNRSDDTLLDDGDAEPSDTEPAGTIEGTEEAEAADQESDDDEEQLADGDLEAVETDEDEAEPTPLPKSKKPEPPPEPEEIKMDWYILKVQSNRERSIAEALERKMRIEGLDRYFDQVIVPTEKVTEFKGGKKKVVERKLYPGYIVVHMHINDNTWFAVRETSGVGDFTGAGGKPTPMLAHEVARIVQTEEEITSESPKLDIKFAVGEKVKVKEGNFENFEGDVGSIDEASGRVVVMINIFGRSTPVELEYWQIEMM
jgi:transcription termination/antitermination protein NusG